MNQNNNNSQKHNYILSEIINYNQKNGNDSILKDFFDVNNKNFHFFSKNKFLKFKNKNKNDIYINLNKQNRSNLSNYEIDKSCRIGHSKERLLSENQKSSREKTYESFKKINYNNYTLNRYKIKMLNDGDYNLKQKIKNSLDHIKKNKELSEKLDITGKELDKMQHFREKYISVIYDNIEIQKNYNALVRRNENNIKEIERQNKKMIENEKLINYLTKEIKFNKNYIKQKEEQNKQKIIQKDEIINKLNNTIENLHGKLFQLQKDNNIL